MYFYYFNERTFQDPLIVMFFFCSVSKSFMKNDFFFHLKENKINKQTVKIAQKSYLVTNCLEKCSNLHNSYLKKKTRIKVIHKILIIKSLNLITVIIIFHSFTQISTSNKQIVGDNNKTRPD